MQLISISIDPEHDTPKIMKGYLKQYRAKPGWDFLTGSREDIDRVMKAFDSYVPDKMYHKQVTFIRAQGSGEWVRIDGLLGSSDLMSEIGKAGEKVTSRRAPAGARTSPRFPGGDPLPCDRFSSAVLSPAAGNDSPVPGLSQEETLRLGERIYRDGILPSGEPLTAVVQGDIPVEGTMFSCVSCHLRSGLGSFEGEVLTPPTNGDVLYKPWNSLRETAKLRKGSMEGSMKLRNGTLYYLTRVGEFPKRPAYTDETLADAIRGRSEPGRPEVPSA